MTDTPRTIEARIDAAWARHFAAVRGWQAAMDALSPDTYAASIRAGEELAAAQIELAAAHAATDAFDAARTAGGAS